MTSLHGPCRLLLNQEGKMKHANFRASLKSGRPQIGTIVSLPSPAVTDCLSQIGFDWLWIDLEHSPMTLEQLHSVLMAKHSDCAGLVRVPINSPEWISRVLDLGADGIIIPHVKTRQDAERVVASAKYPPMGQRSFGAGRAHTYGIDAKHHELANTLTSIVVQIEDKEAIENIEDIIAVEGLDGIIIGPYDLSGSFGKLGEVEDAEIQEAITAVRKACQKNDFPAGIFALHPEQAKRYIDAGFRIVAVGVDIHTLWTTAKKTVSELSPTLAR
jgi:2,4-dihydroxyhept-2-ene-1,7-dioic acid aldolase